MRNEVSSKQAVQNFGKFLSGMIMPNIGAFIAWGLITALFIPTGWLPNESLAKLVGPMITYMFPLLIGYQGGRMVYGDRGAVVGAIATFGVVVGAEVPMFLGAMAMGPLGGYLIKKFDMLVKDKVGVGFEMLVNNFSSGIIGALLAMIGVLFAQDFFSIIITFFGDSANRIYELGVLPLIALVVEPAKVLFLNNAINHGVLGPLGATQVLETGKSIFYLLEANPGPGLGILVAFMLYGKGMAKKSAPGAIIIHFIGGIHEIYFPYILMKPSLILAAIAGGIVGNFTFVILGAGLTAAASPGSIIAILAMAPKGGFLPVLAGVVTAAATSFFVAAILLKTSKETTDLEQATAQVNEMKAESKGTLTSIQYVVFACDAGMGSSAMGASILRKLAKDAGISLLDISHCSVDQIPSHTHYVFTQENLVARAKASAPTTATINTVTNFLDKASYESFINQFK